MYIINIKYGKAKKLYGHQSIFVSFEYNQHIVNIIRLIMERYYDAKTKTWELPYNYVEFLQTRLPSEEFKITGKPIDDADHRSRGKLEMFELPKGLKTKLFEHQIAGFNEIMNYDKYLLLDEVGCGKTLTAIAVALKRKELGAKHCIIITLNSLVFNWKAEVEEHCTEPITVLGARENRKHQLHVKNNADKVADLKNLETYFAVTNIESLQNKDVVKELKKLCKKNKIFIIEDEMHKGVSNSQSIQGKAFLSLEPTYALGMSATLFVNNPLNLYVPLKWVGIETANLTPFTNHYAIKGNFNAIVGYKHLDELQIKLDRCSLRRENKLLNLPSIIFKDEYLVMKDKQKRLYQDVLKQTIADIDKIVLSPNPLAKLTRLRQCTDSPSILSTTIDESIKFDRMLELVDDVLARGEKVIIFSNWAEVIKLANSKLAGHNYVSVTGEVKDREVLYDKFKNDDKCAILTATIGCVGTGLTLISANNVIFLDEPWNYATFKQAYARVHRIGQEKPCMVTSLICKYTVDEKIHNLVYKKKKLGEALLDTQINLRDPEVLRELLS